MKEDSAMTELMLKLNAKFTKEDRAKCAPLVDKMVEMDEYVREHGLLGLEEHLNLKKEPKFLRAALPMAFDALFGPEDMQAVLSTMIISGGYEGYKLLSRLIMAQGIISIMEGENPSVMRVILNTMLGEDYLVQ